MYSSCENNGLVEILAELLASVLTTFNVLHKYTFDMHVYYKYSILKQLCEAYHATKMSFTIL